MAAPKILIVDDEADILDVLEEYLKGKGYEVCCVGSGREALDLLRHPTSPFDAALVDWSIPGIDGKDVIQQVHEILPSCVIFSITGFDREMVMSTAVAGYIRGVFKKPFSLRQLEQQLREALAPSPVRSP